MLVGHMPGRASGWISFFVIAESSELILCSMLETETTESMIIEWGRAVIGFAFRSARITVFGAICFLVPPALQVIRVIM